MSRSSGEDNSDDDRRPAAYRSNNGHTSRSITRRSPDTAQNLSDFYRQRFGSHSPEEYMNLRLSDFDPHFTADEIRSKLDREFRSFQPYEIKVVRNPDDSNSRLAYVNFEKQNHARKIRQTMIQHLQKTFGHRLHVDPAGVIRDQGGKFFPDRFNRSLLAQTDTTKRQTDRRRSPQRRQAGGSGGGQTWRLRQDDCDATRTLFVGNLPGDIKEHEIRNVFERHGKVEEVDIKNPNDMNAAYAFVMFQTVEQASDALRTEHDQMIRPRSTRCKIGYGKMKTNHRIWIGKMGDWASKEMITREFDKFGAIEDVDFEEGSDYAYVTYTDASAAADAVKQMNNFPLGGKDRCIEVEFAKNSRPARDLRAITRKRAQSEEAEHPKAKQPRLPDIETIDQLREEHASTWKGVVLLKKAEYPLKLHRIAGSEPLLQDALRDDSGTAHKLIITQRLALASQSTLEERLRTTDMKQICILMGAANDNDALQPLCKYLNEKQAAGVAIVPEASVYVFSSCEMSDKLLSHFAPNVKVLTRNSSFLLFIIAPKPPTAVTNPSVPKSG
uniref:RRM domain-containing protein n=1 Tax=Steinernema glaseri TaxID=37863 RepID=A0A1I7YL17_9BILA